MTTAPPTPVIMEEIAQTWCLGISAPAHQPMRYIFLHLVYISEETDSPHLPTPRVRTVTWRWTTVSSTLASTMGPALPWRLTSPVSVCRGSLDCSVSYKPRPVALPHPYLAAWSHPHPVTKPLSYPVSCAPYHLSTTTPFIPVLSDSSSGRGGGGGGALIGGLVAGALLLVLTGTLLVTAVLVTISRRRKHPAGESG